MPKIDLANVMNRWWERQFFTYPSDLPPVSTIDDIHRRIRDQGIFDKNDLNAIISHYTTVDPKAIKSQADTINRLYRRLDAIGKFTNLVPEPNSEMLDDFEYQFQIEEDGHQGEWYVPGIIYGAVTNYDSTIKDTSGTADADDYINITRYDNEGRGRPEDTGYEIEFADVEEYAIITLQDIPRSRSFK
jgi:hypothetical protein